MCGECNWPMEDKKMKRIKDYDRIFKRLVDQNATCLEFALNGFIRIYEEGEEKCACLSCKGVENLPH